MRLVSVLAIAVLSFACDVRACIWDSDTLRDERRGLPGIAEILAGRCERHSAFFYEERLKQSAAAIEREPTNLAAWDDLAVAYEKLGRPDRAIDAIEKKAALKLGEYTTEANWGTFLIHRGDLDAGLAHLRRALEINPDAHFGRERYQVMAVEYLIAGRIDPATFERGSFAWPIVRAASGVATTQPDDDDARDVARRAIYRRKGTNDSNVESAIAGVVGMLRFGPGTSPHLYAALGDLLIARGDFHLAYRAFARARDLGHPSRKWIDARLETCRSSSEAKADFDENVIGDERARGEAWTAAYQRFEDDRLRRGLPIDGAALAPFYESNGPAREPLGWMSPREMVFKMTRSASGAVALVSLAGVIGLLAVRATRRALARTRAAAGG